MGVDVKSLTPDELRDLLQGMGEPSYRAGQVFAWLHRGVTTFEEMSDLPSALRAKLAENCKLTTARPVNRLLSKDGTAKTLWAFDDGACVESVLMEYRHGKTVCISTQAGCRMGCAFCASGEAGFTRSLEPSEMLEQVLRTSEQSGGRVSNVVLMGIGEPLDNFDNTVRFLRILSAPGGLNIGLRHVSLSTCGLPGGIPRLAELGLPVTLSVSLHAPDDGLRSELMPVNKGYGVERLVKDCADHFKETGRRVSYEYVMIDGINDSDVQARALARLLRGTGGHLNLIRLNPSPGVPYRPSPEERVERFTRILRGQGINTTLRRSLGADIEGACGQLRLRGMFLNAWGKTDKGPVRQMNQDSFFIDVLHEQGQAVCVVCDGMGGAKAGDVASTSATEEFVREVKRAMKPGMKRKAMQTALIQAVEKTNSIVFGRSQESEDLAGMGTTLVGALIDRTTAVVVNVGDSRAYCIGEAGIMRLTKDHSVAEELLDKGDLTAEEARSHPSKNLITRVIGTDMEVSCDVFDAEAGPGGFLLLCSDGLTNMVTEQEILYEVMHGGELSTCCERLVDTANARGGPDNTTVVLVAF